MSTWRRVLRQSQHPGFRLWIPPNAKSVQACIDTRCLYNPSTWEVETGGWWPEGLERWLSGGLTPLAALAEDTDLVPSTHRVARDYL